MFGHDKDEDDVKNEQPTVVSGPPQPDGVLDDTAAASPQNDGGLPFVPPQKPVGPPAPAAPVNDTDEAAPAASDDLILLKQEALKELSPLVGHLEQTPEEKFRTTMMMIQASDDEKLVKDAFEAAKGIQDDKARAQALLDVINEINYFTQQPESEN